MPASRPLAQLRWPEVDVQTLLVPLGATEQHGPHLPLSVDSVVAQHVAEALAQRAARGSVPMTLGPAQQYGASGEHQDFPGTVSIGTPALTFLLTELARSATRWARRVAIVNGHGGNVDALRLASQQLRAESIEFGWIPCGAAVTGGSTETDLHAGYTETSLMLALQPDSVQQDVAEAGPTEPLGQIIGRLRDRGVREVSPNGVLGDPTGASASEGVTYFDRICKEAWRRLELWKPRDSDGMLLL